MRIAILGFLEPCNIHVDDEMGARLEWQPRAYMKQARMIGLVGILTLLTFLALSMVITRIATINSWEHGTAAGGS